MPVWCRDDSFSGTHRDGQRAGHYLRFLAIRSDVDIRGAHVRHQFLSAHKAVVEDHVRGNAAFLRQRLQLFPIPLTLAPLDMRVRSSGDDVHQIWMFLQNRWQCADHVFNSFVWREQAERKQYGLPLGAKQVLEVIGVHERKIRYAMGNDIDLSARHLIYIAQKTSRVFTHHNQAI